MFAGRMVPAETVVWTVPPETLPENSTGLSSRTFLGQKRLSGNGGGVAVGAGVGVADCVACGVAVGEAFDFAAAVSFSLRVNMLMPPTMRMKRMICPRHPAHPVFPSGEREECPEVSV